MTPLHHEHLLNFSPPIYFHPSHFTDVELNALKTVSTSQFNVSQDRQSLKPFTEPHI